ncbi:hypothetical protein F5888DRAFT_1927142 [Russula emetica]|nr:hypothetical protein F5888DRAFT_1927142 [Russula emetica]
MSLRNCGSGGGDTSFQGLRVASLFIIWTTGSFAAIFPVVARRSRVIHFSPAILESVSFQNGQFFFGSGVIIATAFIHLVPSTCLGPKCQLYPYPLVLAFLSSFCIFLIEVIAFRIGAACSRNLASITVLDPHGHAIAVGAYTAHESRKDSTASHSHSPMGDSKQALHLTDENAMAQLIGVAILEFGVVLHRHVLFVLIGLTLAVDDNFKFSIVCVLEHLEMFEGLGVGSRLAYLVLPPKYRYVPYFGSFLYGITTPIGITVGLALVLTTMGERTS